MQALVVSHLDYSNGIFIGLPKKAIKKMQRIQNMAAKVTIQKSKYDSSTEALKTPLATYFRTNSIQSFSISF